MNKETTAKIFLSGERGRSETDRFRTYHTFHFGGYRLAHKEPFYNLYVLNDDTLASGQTIELLVEEDSELLVLPTVGGIVCKASGDEIEWELVVGECATLRLKEGSTITYHNPFESELVNFMHYWIKSPVDENTTSVTAFDIDGKKNSLLPIASPFTAINSFIGKYDGRAEETYAVSQPGRPLFITVLEGAFEVQNRLLETKDSLGLANIDELEFEALSNDAILVVVELPTDSILH